MRVLVITPYFHPHIGGSQKYIEDLYSEMMRVDKTLKVDVLCYNTDQAPEIEKYKGFTVYRVPCIEILAGQFALPNYLSLFKLLRKLKKNRYDAINSHTRFFDNSWWTPIVAKWFGAKSILTDHCAAHPQHSSRLVTQLTSLLDVLFARVLPSQYDQVVAICQATKIYLNKFSPQSIEVVYPVTTQQRKHSKLGTKLNVLKKLKKNDILVSFAGRLIPAKGALILDQAISPLLKKYPEVHVAYAGSGPDMKKLQKSTHPQKYVLGALSPDQMTSLLSRTDIFVLPTTHHEGLPLSILEAAQAGCLLIATPQGGIPELVQDKKTGFLTSTDLAKLRKCIEVTIKLGKTREKLTQRAKKLVLKLSDPEKSALKMLHLLKPASVK